MKTEKAIIACLENCERLISEAELLEFENPPSTPFYLVNIAQEEAAKAFLLILIDKNYVPWNHAIRRAIKDHVCKQLLSLVLDYLLPDDDSFGRMSEAFRNRDFSYHQAELQKAFDALQVLKYEKIIPWQYGDGVYEDEPDYDKHVTKVSRGYLDRIKQNALYVDIGKDGAIASVPSVCKEDYEKAKDKAERMCYVVKGMLENDRTSQRDKDVMEAVDTLFEIMRRENNDISR